MSEGTNHNDTHGDDLLERSIDAIKHERMPNGPSEDVIARTLSALGRPTAVAPSHNERSSVVTRIFQMTFAQRIAAAVMLTGGALVLWFMFALLGGGTVSYAQVAQQIKLYARHTCLSALRWDTREVVQVGCEQAQVPGE